jgi:carbon-monoxide dehydrogenase catalytic subunit
MSYLDQLNDFASGLHAGSFASADKGQVEQTLKAIVDLMHTGKADVVDEFPTALVEKWKTAGIFPRGIASDVFKASQRLEGGSSDMEETLLWSFKTALLGCMADKLQHRLKTAVFGDTSVSELEVNLGILKRNVPTIIFYGPVSPLLKHEVARAAEKKNVDVMGVCTDPLLPPFSFFPVTTYISQEVPLMTGAVDLIVAGSQFVNPSLATAAREWEVTVVPTDGLMPNPDPNTFAEKIVEQAEHAFLIRQNITQDVPMIKASAAMGYSASDVDMKKILDALDSSKIKGIAVLAGSNNVKYTQDEALVTITKRLLANNILCISEGEASVSLAKYRLLDPVHRDKDCGAGVCELLDSLGEKMPSVIDWCLTDFMLALAAAEDKALSDYPICAYFPEANRTAEVVKAMWTVAMGVSTYFWPCLPVTGSAKTRQALEDLCQDQFGASLHVVTQKIDARFKADLFLGTIDAPERMSGKPWE